MENFTSFDTSSLKKISDEYSPYLAEVKKRIIFTLIFFVITTIAGFTFYEQIIKFLITIFSLEGINIVFTSPFQFINLAISCGIVIGIICTFPLLLFQVLFFLKPALKEKEYKMLIRLLPVSLFLFVVGFVLGSYIMKWQIELFLNKAVALGIGNILDITKLLTTVLITSGCMGLAFQFPVILVTLLRLGIVKKKQLTKVRGWVYLGSFLLVLLLPVDSIMADLFLTIPLILLFEGTLFMSRKN